MPLIDVPYLLVLFGVPLLVAPDGRRYVDRLWAKDLLQHLAYLPRLTLCCYELAAPEQRDDLICLDDDKRFGTLRTVGLPRPAGLADAVRLAPRTAATLWAETGRCRIVHSSVAGWPLPEAWFLTPMLAWRRRLHLIIVESAFWRVPAQNPDASILRRAWSRLQERLARACLDRAQLVIFTQDAYRRSLLTQPERGHVIEASWLDADGIVDAAGLAQRQAVKVSRTGLRVAFFGRLTREKGVLDAIAAGVRLRRAGIDLVMDVYGEGPLHERASHSAREAGGGVFLHSPVPYGPAFFARLADYDAVLVPTLSDEQPRIVFDAFSQGVPVIASDTAGHRQCVTAGETGVFHAPGDVAAVERALREIVADKVRWLALGTACREQACRHTHEAMHERRRRLLEPLLNVA